MRARAYLIDMKIYTGKAVYFLGERDGEALEADEMRHLAILPRDFGALPRQFVSARSLAPAC